MVTGDGDDSHVEKIDEELVTGDFLGFTSAPEQAFVEVLANYGFLIKAHCFSEFAFCCPLFLIER